MDERRENLITILALIITLCLGLTFTTALSISLNLRLLNLIENNEQKTPNTYRTGNTGNY
jgi:hypothetical protein